MNKKGNIGALTATGWALVMFGIIVGLGLLVLGQFSAVSGGGIANSTIQAIMGYLGTSSGGLSSWIPVIIVVVVAGLIFTLFGRKAY